MKVLVCGGRKFDDFSLLKKVLDTLNRQHKITVVIHGDARGADKMADVWAFFKNAIEDEKIKVEPYPADWDKHGKAAGPIRNQQMLNEGKPDLVVAFPGGKGTADMVLKAIKAGVPVEQIIPSAWEEEDAEV